MPPVHHQHVARRKGHKHLKKCQYHFTLNNGTGNRALECTTFPGCSRTQLKPSLKTAWKTQNGDTWTQPRTTGTGQRSNFYHQQWLGKFKGLPLQGPTNEQGPRVKLHVPICSAGAIPIQVSRRRGLASSSQNPDLRHHPASRQSHFLQAYNKMDPLHLFPCDTALSK